MTVPISILIPIKNEAVNLPRCLGAVRWADEVWVVDSQSTDASAAIVAEEALRRAALAQGAAVPQGTDDGRRMTEDGRRRTEDGGRTAEDGSGQSSVIGRLSSEDTQPRVKLVQFKFNGTWPKKKNWALENLPFRHEWVFILDADEVLPPEAEAEIRLIVGESHPEDRGQRTEDRGRRTEVGGQSSVVSHPSSEIAGYWINRRFMFMGRWLRHAYYPNWNLRLFKHRLGRYEKLTDIDTASGDNEVHEHVVLKQPLAPSSELRASGSRPTTVQTGRLKCEMDHYAFPSIEVFVEKHNRYSNWEARVAVEARRSVGRADSTSQPGSSLDSSRSPRRGDPTREPTAGIGGTAANLQMGRVAWRRRLKMLSHRFPFRPTLRFCYVYFWQRGFLDGVEGYYFARLHAVYELLCIAKERELRGQRMTEGG